MAESKKKAKKKAENNKVVEEALPDSPPKASLQDSLQEMLDNLSTANPSMGSGGVELRVMTQSAYAAIESRLIALIEK
jgi:hypothetical protein